MKMKKILTLFLTFLLLLTICVPATAYLENFEIDRYLENHPEEEWERYHFREREGISSPNVPIVTYDVSESGKIILGLLNNKILLFDEHQNLIKTFSFSADGGYYVRWENDHILICFQRERLIAELTETGELLHLIKVDLSTEKNSEALYDLEKNSNITVNGETYSVKKNLFPLGLFGCYASLTKTDAHGTKTVIYSALPFLITAVILGILLLLIVICGFIYTFFKENPKVKLLLRKIQKRMPKWNLSPEQRAKALKRYTCIGTIFSIVNSVIFLVIVINILFSPAFLEDWFYKLFPTSGTQVLWIVFAVTFVCDVTIHILKYLLEKDESNKKGEI